MMEEVISSEMSVDFYEATRCNIPEDSHVQCFLCWNNKNIFD
jgi:hypothetical protein